jgi:hypothetical protein
VGQPRGNALMKDQEQQAEKRVGVGIIGCGNIHVLDVMAAFEKSSDSGQHIRIESQPARPAALPAGLERGKLDTVQQDR